MDCNCNYNCRTAVPKHQQGRQKDSNYQSLLRTRNNYCTRGYKLPLHLVSLGATPFSFVSLQILISISGASGCSETPDAVPAVTDWWPQGCTKQCPRKHPAQLGGCQVRWPLIGLITGDNFMQLWRWPAKEKQGMWEKDKDIYPTAVQKVLRAERCPCNF